jgi:hypothetical protein
LSDDRIRVEGKIMKKQKPKIQDDQVLIRMPKLLRAELETEARSEERPLSGHIRRILVAHASGAMAARAQQHGGQH